MTRRKLGRSIGKKIRMSVIGVIDPDGAYKEFKEVLSMTDKLRSRWSPLIYQSEAVAADAAQFAESAAAAALLSLELLVDMSRPPPVPFPLPTAVAVSSTSLVRDKAVSSTRDGHESSHPVPPSRNTNTITPVPEKEQ